MKRLLVLLLGSFTLSIAANEGTPRLVSHYVFGGDGGGEKIGIQSSENCVVNQRVDKTSDEYKKWKKTVRPFAKPGESGFDWTGGQGPRTGVVFSKESIKTKGNREDSNACR